jgi:hypothetical protein
MPKQWDKQSDTDATLKLKNSLVLELWRGNAWDAVLWLETGGRARIEIMSWEWENIPDIERAKDLAHAALKLWLTELAEGV